MFRLKAFALAALLPLLAGPALATEGSLNWKFTEGDTFQYKLVKAETTALKLGPQNLEITQEQTFWLDFQVASVDENGTATLNMKHERMAFSISNPMMGQDLTWDSAESAVPKGDNPMVGALSKLIGLEAVLVVEPRGRIVSVTGYEAIVEELTKELDKANVPGLGQLGLGNELEASMGNEAFRVLFQRAIVEAPEGFALEAGDSWTNVLRYAFPLAGEVALTLENTYQTTDGDVATINFEGSAEKVEGAGGSESPLAAFMDITFKDSQISGTEHFDTAQGRVLRTELTGAVNLVLTVKGQEGGNAGGMTQSMTQKEKVTFELLDGTEEAPGDAPQEDKEGSEPRQF